MASALDRMRGMLLLAAAAVLAGAPAAAGYTCTGASCCGAAYQPWWPADSCADKASRRYDASIPCSKALEPHAACGLTDAPFACGYGLACVPQTVFYAQVRRARERGGASAPDSVVDAHPATRRHLDATVLFATRHLGRP